MRSRYFTAALAVVFSLGTVAAPAAAQERGSIIGSVVDAQSQEPLAATRVELVEAHRVEMTREDGLFAFPALAPGTYTLTVDRIGYAPLRATIEVKAGATSSRTMAMRVAAIQVDEIVVTGTIGERAGQDVLSATSVLRGAELERKLNGTVAATLADEPGVAVTGIGPTTARPVIRGLGGDRIVMLEDGVRSGDMSSTSSDHAVAIDPLTAQRIEVVRGPMSLLYGSSALGGVVNVVREEIPASLPEHVHGALIAQGESVNRGTTGGAFAVLPVGPWALRLEGTARRSGDVQTPAGTLENTDARTWNAAVGVGRQLGSAHIGASYRFFDSFYGIPGGFVGGHEQGVDVDMERHNARAELDLHDVAIFDEIRTTGSFTAYQHSEIEDNGEIATFFSQDVGALNVLGTHRGFGPVSTGAIGVAAQYRDIRTGGELRTPSTYDYNAAVFAVEELGRGPLRVQAGARFDFAHYEPRDTTAYVFVGGTRVPVRAREFGSLSGSLGVLYAFSEPLRIGVSVARAYRTPDFNELYTNGPHLAANSFDVGDPALGEETGFGVDAFVRYTDPRVRAELAAFRNQLDGYIFPSSRGRAEVGTSGGRPRFQYTNEDARFIGAEGSIEWNAAPRVIVEAVGSLVQAAFISPRADIPEFLDGDTVFTPASMRPPLIPPPNGRIAFRYETPGWFLGTGARLAAEQQRTGDFETPTAAYAVVDLTGGVRILHNGRMHTVTVGVDNALDAEYRDHMSRIKDLMPQPGASVSVLYRLAF